MWIRPRIQRQEKLRELKCRAVEPSSLQITLKEMRMRPDQNEQNSVHDLSVQCKKEWPVLHSIEIEAVKPICERECSYESTFV